MGVVRPIVKGVVRSVGVGVAPRGGGVKWSSYWANQLNFYELWKVNGSGNFVGLIKGDTLTVTGSGLNAIYAVPDTSAYKTIDTDYVFHKSNGDISTACDGNRLIGYDFPRVIVKYADTSPYTIDGIGILDTGQSVNNKLRDDFHLSIWWSNTLNFHGSTKGNRTSQQSVWTAEETVPATLSDTNKTVGWYLSQDLTTITKDGSNKVSLWADKNGTGNNLASPNGTTNNPTWSTSGILFDGQDNVLQKAFTYAQPAFMYIVIKQVTWVSAAWVFDGVSTTDAIQQYSVTPNIRSYGGSAWSNEDSNLLVGSYGIVRILFYGASSKLIVNDNTPIAANWGTTSPGGFTLAARGTLTGIFANIEVKEIILRKVADTSGDEAAIYNYLKSKYSL